MEVKRTIKVVNGVEQTFCIVPLNEFNKLKQSKNYYKKKIERLKKLNAKSNNAKIYYKQLIKEQIKRIDFFIELHGKLEK